MCSSASSIEYRMNETITLRNNGTEAFLNQAEINGKIK